MGLYFGLVGNEVQVRYRNIHTNEVLRLHSKDTVQDGERVVEVYVLEDGTRWDAPHFLANWKLVESVSFCG
jgi:hypothetical protein